MNLIKTFTLAIAIFGGSTIFAQDEFCGESKNKKIKKIYEKLYDTKDRKEQFSLLKETIEIDEYCAKCYYDFATLSYLNSKKYGKPYKVAIEYFTKAIEICPEVHSNAYYTMAMIFKYQDDLMTSLEYMEKHNAFKCDNEKAFASNYDKKVSYFEEMMPEMKFYRDWNNNIVDFVPEPVNNVSSPVSELLPMMSPDNESMFFTRQEQANVRNETIKDGSKYIEPLYLAYRKDVFSEFNNGDKLPKPFNTSEFAGLGGVTISVDNHEMIICGCKNTKLELNGRKVDYKNCDLYVSHFTVEEKDGKKNLIWTDLKPLGEQINTPDGWEATPTLSGDGKTLYFAGLRNGDSDIDIFYSTRQDDGSWGRARKVRGINSNGDDKVPFMHADSKTMYFVSGPNRQKESDAENGYSDYKYERLGAGKFDIYYAQQKEDGSWNEPTLMAKPINTQWDELGLIVSTDGHKAYFATSRMKGSGRHDIYSFPLYKEARPEKVVLFKGEVTDENGVPDPEAVVEISKRGSSEKEVAKVNADGKFAAVINVEDKEDIVITTKKKGTMPSTKLVTKDQVEKMIEKKDVVVKLEEKLKTEPIKEGKEFTIEDLLYATGSSDLTNHSQFVLDQFISYLKENPSIKIEIQGHTDDVGDDEKNLKLSQDRADGVLSYLKKKGISASRLKAKGYGETKPKVKNSSDTNRARNRRTVFYITAV